MTALNQFNEMEQRAALDILAPCVAVAAWREALVNARPYSSLAALLARAEEQMASWGEAELHQALSAHPRIGEKPEGDRAHAALSRQEQSAVNRDDRSLAEALKAGNAQYEARFGRVFLIRAKGRSGQEILQALRQRLHNTEAREVQVALSQLREITLLRLRGVIDN